MASYWLNFALFRRQPESYHALNIALHCLAAAVLFCAAKRLMAISGESSTLWPAAAVAAIFLLHPLQTESVDYVAGRSEVLCGLFVLTGWLLFLERMDKPLRVAGGVLILLCGAAAVLSKESGICLVGILVATDLYWGTGSVAGRLRQRRAIYIPLSAGACIAVPLILRILARSTTAGFATAVTPGSYALTQTHAIVTYLRLFIYPIGLNADWNMPFLHTMTQAWPWAAGLAGVFAVAIVLYRRVRLASFGLTIFLISLAPTSSFIPIADALAERRMYLPVIGLAIAGTAIMARLQLPRSLKAVAVCASLLVCAVLSFARSGAWGDDERLWRESIKQNPRNARPHSSLGGTYIFRGNCAAAVVEYAEAVRIEGLTSLNGRNLAAAYECSKQNEKAMETYKQLVAAHPGALEWTRIGYLEALKSNAADSLAAFENALRLDPGYGPAWSYRGLGRLALGNTEGARSDFKRALQLDAGDAAAALGLSKVEGNN